jgi:hypothetical protein
MATIVLRLTAVEPKHDSCHKAGCCHRTRGLCTSCPVSRPVASSTVKYMSHTQACAKGITPSGMRSRPKTSGYQQRLVSILQA